MPTPTDFQQQAAERVLLRRLLTKAGYGVNVAVAAAATSHVVTFALTEPDTAYGVIVTPSWGTTVRVGSKLTTGFTITFGTAAGAADVLDFVTFRSA